VYSGVAFGAKVDNSFGRGGMEYLHPFDTPSSYV
jgi:hypothetical protein